jgi:hypothetical protein
MIRKGRRYSNAGSKNANAKLTEADVVEARRLASAGVTNRELAKKYGVSEGAMSVAINRITWKHVA